MTHPKGLERPGRRSPTWFGPPAWLALTAASFLVTYWGLEWALHRSFRPVTFLAQVGASLLLVLIVGRKTRRDGSKRAQRTP